MLHSECFAHYMLQDDSDFTRRVAESAMLLTVDAIAMQLRHPLMATV